MSEIKCNYNRGVDFILGVLSAFSNHILILGSGIALLYNNRNDDNAWIYYQPFTKT